MFPAMTALRQITRLAFGAFAVGFLVSDMGKLYDAIVRDSLALGGFSTAAQDAFEEAGKAYDRFYERLKGSAYNKALLEGVRKDIADTQKKIDDIQKGVTTQSDKALALAGGTYGAFGGAAQEASQRLEVLQSHLVDLTAQEEQLRLKLDEATQAHREHTKAVKDGSDAAERAAEAWRRHVEAVEQGHQILPQFIVDLEKLNQQAADKSTLEAAKNFLALGASANMLHFALPALTGDLGALGLGVKQFDAPVFQASPSLLRMRGAAIVGAGALLNRTLPAVRQIAMAYQRQVGASNRALTQLRAEYEQHKIVRGQMEADERVYSQVVVALAAERAAALEREQLAEIQRTIQAGASLLEAVGLRRVAAGVEAVWEMAQGFAALGAYDFWGAAQDFMSAAQYAIIAGTGVPSASAGGGSSATSRTGGATFATPSAVATPGAQQQTTTVIRIEGIRPGELYSGRQVIQAIASGLNQAMQKDRKSVV